MIYYNTFYNTKVKNQNNRNENMLINDENTVEIQHIIKYLNVNSLSNSCNSKIKIKFLINKNITIFNTMSIIKRLNIIKN